MKIKLDLNRFESWINCGLYSQLFNTNFTIINHIYSFYSSLDGVLIFTNNSPIKSKLFNTKSCCPLQIFIQFHSCIHAVLRFLEVLTSHHFISCNETSTFLIHAHLVITLELIKIEKFYEYISLVHQNIESLSY